ncbi:polysaccharide biosynthesis protein [Paenibacillus sp. MER TA 81-3]|uniref:SDR family NAD(P)-dependent oxidoreductase n=1 Tax=Paenibacillus sp. MER TA 81-3 TaxID=2939573 RepID=UPI00203A8190|nr:SDR family NAD(P)-dependent oxidoreductase [Paenibacillus sp. MER TA 81-3]MCM3338742.1 polysaccharide biosynthesis protein [Paenibacillus sp. MER TA 81-3]
MYKDKKILIIGGTGTIGTYLTKQLLAYEPKVIRILSRDEYKQYQMSLDFKEHISRLRFLIGDVRDAQRVTRAMEDVDYVFHLAAMKHVPLCEYNPFEAVKTNVIGTQNVIQAAIHNHVKRVLFTSSDKAICPTNTYGATKLTAERLIIASDYQKGPKHTVFSAVRFGNVMGSRGSVIPLFKKQILEQRKVTITDLNMLRYMMTPSEAISLMLKANEIAQGGEVFVLKMPIIKLKDLAEVLIEEVCAKYNIFDQISIEEIGIRPGEKKWEELISDDERLIADETERMYIIPPFHKKNSSSAKQEVCYTSPQDELPISKETLRRWIREEQLI